MQKHDIIAWAESRREIWLDCFRVYLGLLLITNTSTGHFVDMLQRSGHNWLMTGVMLHYVMLAHFVGGALLALGFLTRIAALVQIPILAGAVFIVHRSDGLFAMGQSLKFSALVLFLLVVFLVSGAGRLSVDHSVFGTPPPKAAEPNPQI